MAGFIFAETQGMQSSAATTASLAEETVTTGAQAGNSVMVPNPMWDTFSVASAGSINQYATAAATHFQAGAGMQANYGQAVQNSAGIYTVSDQTGAADISGAAPVGI